MAIQTSFLSYLMIMVSFSAAHAEEAEMKSVAQLDRGKLPGRQVKVSAICIGFGGKHEVKLKEAIDHLHTAGKRGVDIACLPEEFAAEFAGASETILNFFPILSKKVCSVRR